MKRLLIGCVLAIVAGLSPGCGGSEIEPPKQPVGPATDPIGEAFSKPSKPVIPARK